MCGIAGLIAVRGDHQALAPKLLAAVRHRGPDDEGIAQLGPTVTLVHTRLAILDPSPAGHQPMVSCSTTGERPTWLIFNGEIFNFQELQVELAQLGFPCRTRSDSEVILLAYRAWGPRCVERFVGMFAYCLVDLEQRIAHLYRDRLGIKPLYLCRPAGGGLAFASEVRALLALGPALVPPVVNPAALESYLAQGAVQGNDTLIRDVSQLPAGTTISVDITTGAELSRQRYWQLPTSIDEDVDRCSAVERIGALARDAVRLRLISDVPIGLFLSGGIDSAALLTLAAEVGTGTLRTLSLGFDVEDFDERPAAARTAAAFRTDHRSLQLTGDDVLRALPDVLAAMDQPTVDGTNTYFISRAARETGLTVALSGLGADELFGGYASFSDVPRALEMQRRLGRVPGLAKLIGLRRDRTGVKLAESIRRSPDALSMYLLRRELFLPGERRELHTLPERCDPDSGVDVALLEELRGRSAKLDPAGQISLFELELYMRHMLLRDADVFSMAAPIEYRVPFLDHRLVESVFALPGSWKERDPRPKPLLVDAVGPELPADVWQRPKRGFAFPWGNWFGDTGALAPEAEDSAKDAVVWRRLGCEPAGVRNVWDRFRGGDRRVSPLQLLALVVLRAYAVRFGLHAA